MKSTTSLTAGVLAFAIALSFNAMAAPDTSNAASPQPEMKMKMRPHSHMEEKMGIVAKATPMESAKPAAAKSKASEDQSKHFHPRDGK